MTETKKAQSGARASNSLSYPVLQDFDARVFDIREERGQALVGQRVADHGFDHTGRRGHNVSTNQRTLGGVVYGTDGGRKDFGFKTVVVVNLADVRDQVHAIDVDVIKTSNER